MQQIERVGAVALLFLLVTIVAVAMWDDGSPEEVSAARAEGEGQTHEPQKQPAKEQQATRGRQRPNRNQNAGRERHDGLQTTRAGGPRQQDNLLGGSGQVAQVPNPVQEQPLVVQQDPGPVLPEGNAGRRNDHVIEDRGGDQRILESGWDNGRQGRVEDQPVVNVNERKPERPARKRKNEGPQGGEVRMGNQTHKVAKNESLEQIARKRLGDGQRWPEIAAINGIEGPRFLIREGQTLRLPGGAKPLNMSTPAPRQARVVSNQPPTTAGSRTYKIQSGDVLGTIAQRELGTSKRWKEIVALNPGLDPKKLFVGTTILLPTTGTPVPESSLVANVRTDSNYRVR